jgi:hypothetical protein
MIDLSFGRMLVSGLLCALTFVLTRLEVICSLLNGFVFYMLVFALSCLFANTIWHAGRCIFQSNKENGHEEESDTYERIR